MWREAVVLCALTSVAFAALALQPLEPKPKKYENVPGCYVSELDDVIPLGQSSPSLCECKEYRCQEKYVQIATCGVAAVVEPYYLDEDKSLPYPDCCPQPKLRTTP